MYTINMLENMLILNKWVATGTLLLEIGLLVKLLSLIILSLPDSSVKKDFKKLINDVSESILNNFNLEVRGEKFLLGCIFVFSFFTSAMTLVYSEIFLQIPCALCWFQRIFMYGIVVLNGIALFGTGKSENKKVVQKFQLNNILVFSVFGFFFAIYQHLEQFLALYGTNLPCPVSGADCAKMTLFEYGHITFPWMAVVLFAFFIVIILLQRKLK